MFSGLEVCQGIQSLTLGVEVEASSRVISKL